MTSSVEVANPANPAAPAKQDRPRRDNRDNRDRPKSVYTTIKDFTDDETKVTVRLQRSNDYPRPRYSFQIGRLQETNRGGAPGVEARLVPFLNVRIQTHLGKIQNMSAYSARVENLLLQAEEYVHNEAQLTEDQILDTQISRDEKYVNRGKPQTKVTGKTQRERDKRRGGKSE